MASPRHPVSAHAVALVQMDRLQVDHTAPSLTPAPIVSKDAKGELAKTEGDVASTFPHTDICLLRVLVRQQ